jgi:oligosaccharide repeat unit polymerase
MLSTTDIITDLVFITIQLVILLFSYQLLEKKISQPAVLFSLVWFSILALHFIFKFTLLDELESLSADTYLIFTIGCLCFSLGSILSNYSYKILATPGDASIPEHKHTVISLKLRIILVVLITAILPVYIYSAYKIFLASQAEEFFSGLRYELSYGDADIGPTKYFMPLAYVVYAVCLYAFYSEKNKINRLLLIISFVVLAGYAFFATGRTYFFMILAVYYGVSFFSNPNFSIRKQFAWLTLFIIGFMIIGVLYGKGGNADETLNNNVKSASEYTGVYLVGSLNALEREITDNSATVKDGDNTLRFFTKLGMQLKILPQRTIPDLKQEFVFVPYPTNVYTYYSPYIRDFGKAYAWVMLAIFGVLHTWLFKKAEGRQSPKYIFYYAFLLFPLLLSFFGDQYLSLFSFWIQLCIYTEFFFRVNKNMTALK